MKARKRVLLIDADIVAYQACATYQTASQFLNEAGEVVTHVNPGDIEDCKAYADGFLANVMEDLKAHLFVLAFSDPVLNWRKEILPTYKGNRDPSKKPLHLPAVRAWMAEKYGAYQKPKLEGDDVLGIIATSGNQIVAGEKIIVSIDKDLKTIPGLIYRPGKTSSPVRISEWEADKFHAFQTLTGDPTDFYKGCPGIGPKKAARILEDATPDTLWPAVRDAFLKAGRTEEDALVQARVARICRRTEYDFDKQEVRLWTPQ